MSRRDAGAAGEPRRIENMCANRHLTCRECCILFFGTAMAAASHIGSTLTRDRATSAAD